MIRVTAEISIPADEIRMDFVRSDGPGGQNVNKTATTVQLRFDIRNSPSLTDDVKHRLTRLGGRRVTDEGVLILQARRYRTQGRNRQDALERLTALVRRAATPPKCRRRTRPTAASRQRRLDTKRRQSQTKKLRGDVRPDE